MAKLGRVLDPEELDRAPGPRGRLVVEVPGPWLAAEDVVEIVVPRRVTCARCEGGGCDDCGRSGALRLPADDTARTLQLGLPVPAAPGNLVRLVRPLGPDAGLDQLWLELRVARAPSPFCQRLARPRPTARPSYAAALIALAVALLVAAALFLR